jgi:hypothetical protein
LSAFGLLDRVQVGDTGPAESTRRGNLQRVGLLFLGSRDNNDDDDINDDGYDDQDDGNDKDDDDSNIYACSASNAS